LVDEQAWPLELDSSASAAPFLDEQQPEGMQHHHTWLVEKQGEGIQAQEEVEVRL